MPNTPNNPAKTGVVFINKVLLCFPDFFLTHLDSVRNNFA